MTEVLSETKIQSSDVQRSEIKKGSHCVVPMKSPLLFLSHCLGFCLFHFHVLSSSLHFHHKRCGFFAGKKSLYCQDFYEESLINYQVKINILILFRSHLHVFLLTLSLFCLKFF